MIAGVGVGMVELARVRRILDRRPSWLSRWFSAEELDRAYRRVRPEGELTGRLACKIAVRRCLAPYSAGPIALAEVKTLNDERGKPYVDLSMTVRRSLQSPPGSELQIEVSITNARDHAAAVALLSWT